MRSPHPIPSLIMAFVAALAIVGSLALKSDHSPIKDEIGYLQIVRDLNEHHVFTDAGFASPEAALAPGRFLAPAYPILVHALSRLDPALADAISCHVEDYTRSRATCGGSFGLLLTVQAILMAAGAMAIFWIALDLTRSQPVAWLALALALAFGEMRNLPQLMLSENVALPAFLGFLACATAWADRGGSAILAAAGGALLCIAALTRPSYLYLFYAAALVLVAFSVWPQRLPHRRKSQWRDAALFAIAGALVLAPWMWRNAVLFGDVALTDGYGGFTLAQRVAYNAMTATEWLIACVYWLPDFGDNLIKSVLPKSEYVRLGWTDPASFYKTGTGVVFTETLAAAGSREAHQGYLLRHHVFGDLLKHVAVTLPLTWRGIFAGGYLALAGLIIAPLFSRHVVQEGHLAALLALVVPLLFMAGLHGFVSVNIVRYNAAMIAFYATAIAWAIVAAWRHPSTAQRFLRRSP